MDLSQREFKTITGFQYAVFVWDWHMWMLLKYLPPQSAAEQLQEFNEKGMTYWVSGKNGQKKAVVGKLGECLWHSFISVLDTLVQNWESWSEDHIHRYWCEVVGEQQRLLPVYVVNEYCHPARSFSPCPEFKEEHLVRTRVTAKEKDWFQGTYRAKPLGKGIFAWQRGEWQTVQARSRPSAVSVGAVRWFYYRPYSLTAKIIRLFINTPSCERITLDSIACQRLAKMRPWQLAILKRVLERFKVAKASLQGYLLSALLSLVLEYFSEDTPNFAEMVRSYR